MKYTLFVLVSLLMCSNGYAQGNSKLDYHRRFKEINLGDNFEKWSAIIDTSYYQNNNRYGKIWKPPIPYNLIFNESVNWIELKFYNDKIETITIYVNPTSGNGILGTEQSPIVQTKNRLEAEFNRLFGRPTCGLLCWEGKKTRLKIYGNRLTGIFKVTLHDFRAEQSRGF